MGKSDRAFVLGAAALAVGCGIAPGAWLAWTFALVAAAAMANEGCPLSVDSNDVETKPVTWRCFADAYGIEAWPVSPDVGNVRNNRPDLIERVA